MNFTFPSPHQAELSRPRLSRSQILTHTVSGDESLVQSLKSTNPPPKEKAEEHIFFGGGLGRVFGLFSWGVHLFFPGKLLLLLLLSEHPPKCVANLRGWEHRWRQGTSGQSEAENLRGKAKKKQISSLIQGKSPSNCWSNGLFALLQ